MSDEENESITSDYFSESTPQSCKSLLLDHKYALSPTTSLTSLSSLKSRKISLKRRKLFAKEYELNKTITNAKVTPLSERQQLAIALQLSANQSKGECYGRENGLNDALISTKSQIRRNNKGETELHIASIKGDLNRVKRIIAHNKHDIDITDFAGWAAIHEACNRGFVSIVEELLKAGANVNAKGYHNYTPLIDASVNGHHKLVQLLLKYGADYNLKNNLGKTALEVAKSDRVIEVINSFIEEKMRKNCGNKEKEKDIVNACLNRSRATSPSNCTSPSKPTSPRLTLRFQTIKSEKSIGITTAITHTQSSCSSTMASTKSYSVSTTIDKDKDTLVEPSFSDKQNDNNNKVITSNGSSLETVSASSDHNYTSFDSMTASDDANRGRKRRKSNDGSVSSTSVSSLGPSPSRSSSTSSVASSTLHNSLHNKRHHHHHHHTSHTSHHSSKTNTNNTISKDKSVKKSYSSSSDSEVEGSERGDKETNNKDVNNQTLNSSTTNVGNTASEVNSPKVPPLRIVLPANTSNMPSTAVCVTTASNGGTQSYVSSTVTSTTSSSVSKFPYVVSSSDETFQCESDSVSASIASQRITRSSQRVAQQQSQKTSGGNGEHQSDSEDVSLQADSQHPRKRKIRNNNTNDTKNNSLTINSYANNSVNNNNSTTVTHNSKEGDNDNDSSSSSSSVKSVNGLIPKEVSPFALPSTNCYQMFLSIRKNVDKKRKEMFLVQPKAPQGFKDYLINRCSYILEGKVGSNNNRNNGSGSINTKPSLTTPPTSLTPGSGMYNVFCEQEKQRYKLKIQHMIEREKLVLSAEQEILRVHGRAARAMANQNVPFSVCTILKDEEIYNILETETDQNETISNQIKVEKPVVTGLSGRTRYNGRLFLSWLQDVDDKWEKIKESMLLRHRKESESLLAMQKLEWEWKLKELGLCDLKINPTIDEIFVSAVHVSDDFDLFPA